MLYDVTNCFSGVVVEFQSQKNSKLTANISANDESIFLDSIII